MPRSHGTTYRVATQYVAAEPQLPVPFRRLRGTSIALEEESGSRRLETDIAVPWATNTTSRREGSSGRGQAVGAPPSVSSDIVATETSPRLSSKGVHGR